MQIMSYADFRSGMLSNPHKFPLALFHTLFFKKSDMDVIGFSAGNQLIIAKDEDGNYMIGIANRPDNLQGWNVMRTHKDDWYISIDHTFKVHQKDLHFTIPLSQIPIRGFDMNGPIILYKIELS